MKPRVAFFTVCGGGDDYEFLLGAIEHHAAMGTHLVLDTTPTARVKRFEKLPDTVLWIHEPVYGEGWKSFRLRSAVERCMRLAQLLDAEVLVYLDSDEFYISSAADELFPLGVDAMLEVGNVHWRKDGNPYVFGSSEWHARVWPRKSDVKICANTAWPVHPSYNGNPEHHPVPAAPKGLKTVRVEGYHRHHLHYAIGAKADDDETARTTIDGWPDRGRAVPPVSWPEKLARWKNHGEPPSDSFR